MGPNDFPLPVIKGSSNRHKPQQQTLEQKHHRPVSVDAA
jgi:hypothetical protein